MASPTAVVDGAQYAKDAILRLLRYYAYGVFAHLSLSLILIPGWFAFGFGDGLGLPAPVSVVAGVVVAAISLVVWEVAVQRYSSSDEKQTAVAAD